MKIVTVPVWSDNFAYLVVDDTADNVAFVVDPVDTDKVMHAADKEKAKISAILTTHHHHDHSGGNVDLAKKISNLEVYGGDDRIPALTKKVTGDDSFTIGNLKVKVLFTPCHTSGHVLYLVDGGSGPQALFTGDTLFIAGCGRFFEGTAKQMHHALVEVIARLPDNTQIYCGHEYTKKNLQFAQTIEPSNQHIKEKLEWATTQVEKGLPTVPSTVGDEKLFNPFMRVEEPTVAEAVGLKGGNAIDVMAAVRAAKDKF